MVHAVFAFYCTHSNFLRHILLLWVLCIFCEPAYGEDQPKELIGAREMYKKGRSNSRVVLFETDTCQS